MSVGFVVNERTPIAATGHWLVSGLLRNLLFDVAWTADVVILDAPPGTGEEIQVMVRELPLSGGLFVTTPQDLAQMERVFSQEVPSIPHFFGAVITAHVAQLQGPTARQVPEAQVGWYNVQNWDWRQ